MLRSLVEKHANRFQILLSHGGVEPSENGFSLLIKVARGHLAIYSRAREQLLRKQDEASEVATRRVGRSPCFYYFETPREMN